MDWRWLTRVFLLQYMFFFWGPELGFEPRIAKAQEGDVFTAADVGDGLMMWERHLDLDVASFFAFQRGDFPMGTPVWVAVFQSKDLKFKVWLATITGNSSKCDTQVWYHLVIKHGNWTSTHYVFKFDDFSINMHMIWRISSRAAKRLFEGSSSVWAPSTRPN